MSADAFSDHIDHRVKYMLSEVDATADQKAQVTSILQSAARDVHALKDQHVSAHKQLHEILSAETIDRARLETVRADQIRLADEASQRFVSGHCRRGRSADARAAGGPRRPHGAPPRLAGTLKLAAR